MELFPLKYKDIVLHDKNLGTTDIDIYINEIETCISKISDWRSLLLFDLDSLLFTMKYISVSEKPLINLTSTCYECNNPFTFPLKISDLKFTDMTELLKVKSINLNSTEFLINHTVTIGDFYELLLKLKTWKIDIPRCELFLIAYLIQGENINQVYDTVTSSTTSDIAVISEMESRLLSTSEVTVKCPKCGKEVVIKLNNLITNIFQILYLNSDVSSKITYIK